jgi:hypothetical protein
MGTGHLRLHVIRVWRHWRRRGTCGPSGWFLCVAGVAAILAGASIGLAATAQPVTVARMSLNELAGQADLICICRMTGQQSEWDGDKNMLVTVVTLQTEEVLKGAMAAGSDLQVDLFSSFTSEQLNVGGAAFEQGERAVLFLKPAGTVGPAGNTATRYTIVGWAQGKFTIRTNPKTGEERVVRRLEGIHFTPSNAGGSDGGMPRTLGELRSAIRVAVNPPVAAPSAP